MSDSLGAASRARRFVGRLPFSRAPRVHATMATPRKADATRSLPRTLAGVPQACRERRRAARLVRSPLSAGFSGP